MGLLLSRPQIDLKIDVHLPFYFLQYEVTNSIAQDWEVADVLLHLEVMDLCRPFEGIR